MAKIDELIQFKPKTKAVADDVNSNFEILRLSNNEQEDYLKKIEECGADAVIISDPTIIELALKTKMDVHLSTQASTLNYETCKFWKNLGVKRIVLARETTKEEIKFLLSKFGKAYATVGNHNNFVGVPESLCNMDMTADFAVIEMGMSAKGEISRLTSYVKPDIAIVTNVYPMHIEFFNEFKDIAYAKAEIFEGLSSKGIAIINEDADFYEILEEIAKKYTNNIVRFGKNCRFDVKFETSAPGEHHIYNALCALKVIDVLGLDMQKASSFIKDFEALDGRGKRHKLKLKDGVSYTLIDDSYSGQPDAMKIAIKALNDTKTEHRKIAVLGKMAELGNLSKTKHIEIGHLIEQTDIDVIVGVCPEMKDMLNCISDNKEKYYFENKESLVDFLLNKLLQKDDIVLIKGARYSSKLYQVAEELINKGK